jgi:hypothetical protein
VERAQPEPGISLHIHWSCLVIFFPQHCPWTLWEPVKLWRNSLCKETKAFFAHQLYVFFSSIWLISFKTGLDDDACIIGVKITLIIEKSI